MRTLLLTLIIIYSHNIYPQSIAADLVIFSYDRPLQLYALLESINVYVKGLETINIIYRTSDHHFAEAYKKVQANFPNAIFTKQGENPKKDFKQLTLDAVFKSPTDYILFAVDDNIFTDYVDIEECIQMLEQTNTYAFFLRLGIHLQPPIPPVIELNKTFCTWRFDQGSHNWRYPHTVDCTIYRKTDITKDLHTLNYNTPNTFESSWSGKAYHIQTRLGLCYKHTKIINLALNQVQNDWAMPHIFINKFSSTKLLALFNEGFKIDIRPLHQIDNISTHIEANIYEPTFIKH